MSGRVLRIVLIACAALVLLAPGAGAAERMRITGTPALFPGFNPTKTDYVSRCGATGHLKLTFHVPPGETASVDAGPAKAGDYDENVDLGAGQGVVINARLEHRDAHFHVRCLPSDFPAWSVVKSARTQAQWYLVTPAEHLAAMFNSNGVPIWWRRVKETPFNPTLLPDGTVAWYETGKIKFGTAPNSDWDVFPLSGRRIRRVRAVGVATDLHEIQQLPNGDYMVDAFRPRRGVDLSKYGGPKAALVYYAEIQEIAPNGRLVWRWNARHHIALDETGRYWRYFIANQAKHPAKDRYYDAMHVNSIAPDGDGFVISCRHTDALYRIDKRTGRIVWKLGGTKTRKSLAIRGGSRVLAGQHDVRVLPDGTISVYDNGLRRNRPPRVLRIKVNLRHRSAKILEKLSDPSIRQSGWGGSARRMAGGDWVVGWGGTDYVSEMTPAGDRIFQLGFPGIPQYRADAIPHGVLSAERLRDAMSAMHPRGG